jgi:tripartite ATP-independent transporter DctM subunit
MEFIPLYLFAALCIALMLGYSVAFTLAGISLLFAGFGIVQGVFPLGYVLALPDRIFGIVNNSSLIAVPLFVLMGMFLEKSKLAENLLVNMAQLMGRMPGGLAISVVLVGALLAASTGIVGASVVTMGLISLPTLLKHRYGESFSTGLISATGTLGQIIPPSIALVILGDVISTAYQQAQISMGVFNPKSVSIGDLFVGAFIPGILLVLFYIAYVVMYAIKNRQTITRNYHEKAPPIGRLLKDLMPPIALILLVLGSIVAGVATPTEAAGLGALGAFGLACASGNLDRAVLQKVLLETLKITAMVFMILMGAALFSLTFRGFGGDELVQSLFAQLPGGTMAAVFVVMLLIFLLGFVLDFIEITFVVVPIFGPILLMMGVDPIWLGIMIAINLQTSFLTPPFGFALFYLRGVAPESIATTTIYKGVIPFIVIQLLVLLLLAAFPALATWLPAILIK